MPREQSPVPSRPPSRELMVNLASATGWEARAAWSPGHSRQSLRRAGHSRAGMQRWVQATAPGELRGEGACGGGSGSHVRGSSPQRPWWAQQALPVGPVLHSPLWEGGRNGELPPQATGQRGEAEGPLFPFLPPLVHPKHSCSISWHLDGVGPPPNTLSTLGKPYHGGQ